MEKLKQKGLLPNDTIHACWDYPSTALVNCQT
jgi:hypothetical protein